MPYTIDITFDADEDLERLTARDRRIILAEIRTHLTYEPMQHTLKRKHLKENELNIPWELRVGTYRVLYKVEGNIVYVLAIATKQHNDYYIKGKKVKL